MRVCISGGAGYLGTALLARLIREGDTEIVVLDRLDHGAAPLTAFLHRCQVHVGDVRDPRAVAIISATVCSPVVTLSGTA